MYEPGENLQLVQEKDFWCTNWVNNGKTAPQRWGRAKRYGSGEQQPTGLVKT